ncbi:MAG: YicC/YloC family endoribonuclease, partial [Candidatus Kryptoniota bacterium]
LPQSLAIREGEIREMIRQRFSRGKISMIVTLDRSGEEPQFNIEMDSVRRIVSLLNQIRKTARVKSTIKLDHILMFKDLIKGTEFNVDEGEEWAAAAKAIEAALDQLSVARKNEGNSLKADLVKRISLLKEATEKIEKISVHRSEEGKERLRQKVKEVLNGQHVDPARIELEIVLLADKLDITEEVVRFRTHADFFLNLLNAEESNGRRLNFLLQEMNREVNTMGSKAFDAEVSHIVVEIKEELEKIREQVQNLE